MKDQKRRSEKLNYSLIANLLSCAVVKEQVVEGPSPTILTAETSQE